MSELKNCPFCGSEDTARLLYNDRADVERCRNCNLSIVVPFGFTMWNNRPIEDALHTRIAELEAERRWIPVSERLPKRGQPVLVLTKGEGIMIDKLVPDMPTPDGVMWWMNNLSYFVAHWMPLPELPEDK